jgi:hypothetical protein
LDDGRIISADMDILYEILGNLAKEFEIQSAALIKFVGIQIKEDQKTGVISRMQSTCILDLLNKFSMDELKPTTGHCCSKEEKLVQIFPMP